MSPPVWSLPSRGRPASIARLAEAYTRTGAMCRVHVRLDQDDPALPAYLALELPEGWTVQLGPRIGCQPCFNEPMELWPEAEGYGILGDDALPLTDNWDRILAEAAGLDKIAYAADLLAGEAQVTYGIVGGDLARSIGFIALPGLIRLCSDTVLTLIGKRRGVLCYRPDVVIEHMHFSNGKAPFDETYAKPEGAADKALYDRWLEVYEATGDEWGGTR